MSENPQSAIRNPQSFELAPSEVRVPVAFREGGRRFRVVHVFRAPSAQNWFDYEAELNTRIEEQGAEAHMDARTLDAAEKLWNACALRVEGYNLPGGGSPALDQVPLPHKAAAVRGLGQASVAEPEVDLEQPYEFDPTQVVIELEAARDGQVYTGLKHELRRPTAQELKEFSRITSAAIWLRGARTPTTLLPSRLKALVDLYDSLIVAVQGYTVKGQPAVQGDVQKYMDAMHKKVVIQALFAPEEATPEKKEQPE